MLDVGGLTSLSILYCNNNELTTLDVGGLTSLGQLLCYDNDLASLVLDADAPYWNIDARNNYLTKNAVTSRVIPWDTGGFRFTPQKTIAALLESIAVTTQPTKSVYIESEALDLDGMVVTAT